MTYLQSQENDTLMLITLAPNKPQVSVCTRKQRETIDLILRKLLWLNYSDVILLCNNQFNRKIKELLDLTKEEADTIIKILKSQIT